MYVLIKNIVYRLVGDTRVEDKTFLDEKRVYISMLELFNKIARTSDLGIKQASKEELKVLHEDFNAKFGDIKSEIHKEWTQLDPRSTFLDVLTPNFYQVTSDKKRDIKGQYDIRTAIQESWKQFGKVDESTLKTYLTDKDLAAFRATINDYLKYIARENRYVPHEVYNSSSKYADLRATDYAKEVQDKGVVVPDWSDFQFLSALKVLLEDWSYDKSKLLVAGGILEKLNYEFDFENHSEGKIFLDNNRKRLGGRIGSLEPAVAIKTGIILGLHLGAIPIKDENFLKGKTLEQAYSRQQGKDALEVFERYVYGKGLGHAAGKNFEQDICKGFIDKYAPYMVPEQYIRQEVAEYHATRVTRPVDSDAYRFFKFDENMNKNIEPYENQYRAAVRVLETPKNQILNHGVGSGKTWTAAIALIEGKRKGYYKRPAYVVPHLLIVQTRDEILSLYPDAKIYTMQSALLQKNNYAELLDALFEKNDFDLILMSTAQFNRRMGVPHNELRKIIATEVRDYKEAVRDIYKHRRNAKNFDEFINNEVMCKYGSRTRDHQVDIKALRIDKFFIDEAHVYFDQMILGRKAKETKVRGRVIIDMLDFYYKAQYISDYTNNRGLVLMTGSPVDKNIATMFVIETILDLKGLKQRGEYLYDFWYKNYEKSPEVEVKIRYGDGPQISEAVGFTGAHVDRIKLLMDTVSTLDSQKGLPPYEVISEVTALDPRQNELVGSVREANKLPGGTIQPRYARFARIMTIHERLLLPELPESTTTSPRIARHIDIVMNHYHNPSIENSTQLILCDFGTPKAVDSYYKEDIQANGKPYFNLYKHIKKLLVGRGVPEEEIAFVIDATTATKKAALFADINAGIVRIVIGCTRTIGTGANIQERLEVLHNVDIVSHNFKFEQRVGRIVRKGNTCPKVFIYNYISSQEVDILGIRQLMQQRNASETVFKATTNDGGSVLKDFDFASSLSEASPNLKESLNLLDQQRSHYNRAQQLKTQLEASKNESIRLENELAAKFPTVEVQSLQLINSDGDYDFSDILDADEQNEANRIIYNCREGVTTLHFKGTSGKAEFDLRFEGKKAVLTFKGLRGSQVAHISPFDNQTDIINIALSMIQAQYLKKKTFENHLDLQNQIESEIRQEESDYEQVRSEYLDLDKDADGTGGKLMGYVGDAYGSEFTPKGNKIALGTSFQFVTFGAADAVSLKDFSEFTCRLERGRLKVRAGEREFNDTEIQDLLVLGSFYGDIVYGLTHMGVYKVLRDNGSKVNALGFDYLKLMDLLSENYRAALSKLKESLDADNQTSLAGRYISFNTLNKRLSIPFRDTMAFLIYRCKINSNKMNDDGTCLLYNRNEHLASFKSFLKGYPFKDVTEKITRLPEIKVLSMLRDAGVLNIGAVPPKKVTDAIAEEEARVKAEAKKAEEAAKAASSEPVEIKLENEFWKTDIKNFAENIYKLVKTCKDAEKGKVNFHRVPIFVEDNSIGFINVPAMDPVQRRSYSVAEVIKAGYAKAEKGKKTNYSIKLASLFLKKYASSKPENQSDFAEMCYNLAASGKDKLGIEVKEKQITPTP